MPSFARVRVASMSMACSAGLLAAVGALPAQAETHFDVTRLVSDGSVPARTTDPDLVNPWGIASAPTGPFWIADNGTGVSTLYNTGGHKLPLTVTVTPPAAGSAPTGIVFNGGGGFAVSDGKTSGTSVFIFGTEDGAIDGWAPSVATGQTFVGKDNTAGADHAVYKGLAIAAAGGAIYATDFHNNAVDQYDSSFNLVRAFTDSGVAAGYAPFGAQVIGGHLFVTYALQDADRHDDVAGAGHGYVDEFNLDGTLVKQLVMQGGQVNSPWGMAIAPASFGTFAGDLLVGNFGDGTISAFNLSTGAFEGKLLSTKGTPIVLGDLWGLLAGNGGPGGDASKIYFTAGIADEAQGLFGALSAAPEPSTWAMALLGVGLAGAVLRRRRAQNGAAAVA